MLDGLFGKKPTKSKPSQAVETVETREPWQKAIDDQLAEKELDKKLKDNQLKLQQEENLLIT